MEVPIFCIAIFLTIMFAKCIPRIMSDFRTYRLFVKGLSTYEVSEQVGKIYPNSDFFPLYHFIEKLVVVRDPKLAKRILSQNETFARAPNLKVFADVFYLENVFTTDNISFHDSMRSMISDSLKNINQYFDKALKSTNLIIDEIDKSIDENGGIWELVVLVEPLVLRVFAITFLDLHMTLPQAISVTRNIKQLWRLKGKHSNYRIYRWNPWSWNKVLKLRKNLLDVLEQANNANRSRLDNNENMQKINEKINLHVPNPNKRERAENLANILIPGYEALSRGIVSLVVELFENPEVEKNLLDECQIFQEDPTVDSMQKLHYLEAVWKETLRCFPPTPNIVREVVAKNDLFPIGTTIAISVMMIHRDPNFWADPNRFYPDRFIDSSLNQSADHFMPFSVGPRQCVATRFTSLLAKLIIIGLISHFKISKIGRFPIMNHDDYRGPTGRADVLVSKRNS